MQRRQINQFNTFYWLINGERGFMNSTFLSTLLVVLLSISCSKETPLKASLQEEPKIDCEYSDYELIGDETMGTLVYNGEVEPNISPVSGDSPDAKFLNRCILIWLNMNWTKYVHYSDREINEATGVYKYDCSGFIGEFVLEKVLANHYIDLCNHMKDIIDIDGEPMNLMRPLTASFYDYFYDEILVQPNNVFAENDYWQVFTTIDSLKRGDVIVVRYADSWRLQAQRKTTGHMMIAWEIGHVNSENIVEIQVMDAAASRHTSNADTRTCNPTPIAEELNGNKSGIGFGRMLYLIGSDEQKRPHAYKWSLNSSYWYNLVEGDTISEPNAIAYDRVEGILFARPK